jgi:hypothetical protein
MIRTLRAISILFAVFLFLPNTAQARRLTYGETITNLGTVVHRRPHPDDPEQPKEPLQYLRRPLEVSGGPGVVAAAQGRKVGFKYKRVGLGMLDLWTWGGEYCLYEETPEGYDYIQITPGTAAFLLGVPKNKPSKPFLYTVPLGWILAGGMIFVGLLRHPTKGFAWFSRSLANQPSRDGIGLPATASAWQVERWDVASASNQPVAGGFPSREAADVVARELVRQDAKAQVFVLGPGVKYRVLP